MMEFKDKVKTARLKLYLSQESLAKELGIAFATVNRWETGAHLPTLMMQKKFFEFCSRNGIEFDNQLTNTKRKI